MPPQFGLSTADASTAALYPFVAGAVGSLVAGTSADWLVGRCGLSLTAARKLCQSVALGGPALAMLALALLSSGAGGLALTRDEAEVLFISAVGLAAFSSSGFGCGAQVLVCMRARTRLPCLRPVLCPCPRPWPFATSPSLACGVQDISTRLSSLLYGSTSVPMPSVSS